VRGFHACSLPAAAEPAAAVRALLDAWHDGGEATLSAAVRAHCGPAERVAAVGEAVKLFARDKKKPVTGAAAPVDALFAADLIPLAAPGAAGTQWLAAAEAANRAPGIPPARRRALATLTRDGHVDRPGFSQPCVVRVFVHGGDVVGTEIAADAAALPPPPAPAAPAAAAEETDSDDAPLAGQKRRNRHVVTSGSEAEEVALTLTKKALTARDRVRASVAARERCEQMVREAEEALAAAQKEEEAVMADYTAAKDAADASTQL